MIKARAHRLRLLPRLFHDPLLQQPRFVSLSAARPARVFPELSAGPPPKPPRPIEDHSEDRRGQKLEAGAGKDGKKPAVPSRRFWQTVSVRLVDGHLVIYLDDRPLKHPRSKSTVQLPVSKPNLAAALAIEWERLTSAQQAAKDHLVPMTSLICRALDIKADDDQHSSSSGGMGKIRSDITTAVLRYLDTDSLLCWAPPAGEYDTRNSKGESLREVQERFAAETVSFLTTHIWPGVNIEPVLDGHSLTPREQAPGVREVVQDWVQGLSSWELAGLERAVLAGKSLLIGARLVTQWSEESVWNGVPTSDDFFGVEQAAEAASIEVDWQTDRWGMVEDTHDVNYEDLRRQLGSAVLLVSGTGGDASAVFKR
ncbi:ATP12 ATPase family protein [Ophiocordyceps camponoti-floridani]|uniref:ATP12 ATPase family protein n=1 Tax=Ophiocordyceps camponoti-floridani TaxID=2030778 RepID=A0A8H4VBP5_9HYPO|nr:ATP12 ATPase family protein [Ophiocordyceps camponoti-floridani]